MPLAPCESFSRPCTPYLDQIIGHFGELEGCLDGELLVLDKVIVEEACDVDTLLAHVEVTSDRGAPRDEAQIHGVLELQGQGRGEAGQLETLAHEQGRVLTSVPHETDERVGVAQLLDRVGHGLDVAVAEQMLGVGVHALDSRDGVKGTSDGLEDVGSHFTRVLDGLAEETDDDLGDLVKLGRRHLGSFVHGQALNTARLGEHHTLACTLIDLAEQSASTASRVRQKHQLGLGVSDLLRQAGGGVHGQEHHTYGLLILGNAQDGRRSRFSTAAHPPQPP
jgi:hypothetical protein